MARRLHRGSMPYSFLGEELTSIPDTFIDIEEELDLEIPPTNSVVESDLVPLEYLYLGTPDQYVLLCDSYLHMKGCIQNADGSNLADKEQVAPVNLWGHALISRSDVYLNETLTSKDNALQPYKAYMAITVGYGSEAKVSWLQAEGGYQDAPGNSFDSVTTKPSTNGGFIQRSELAAKSAVVDLVVKPHIDLFMQARPLPPNTNLRIKLYRTPVKFNTMADGSKQFKVKIISASLYLRIIKVDEHVSMIHREKLMNNGRYVYPIRRIVMKSFTITSGVLDHTRPNLLNGQLPRLILMGITTNKAFNGDYTKSPFRFQPFNMRKANLLVNGVCVPSRPYIFNFDRSEGGVEYVRAFRALSEINGSATADRGNGITRTMFEDGYTIVPFILSHDYNVNGMGLFREGSVQIEIEFSKATSEVLTVILFIEYENTITIGKHGDVVVDY